jgi:macrolide transport system ATP-binding/permease protein
MSQDPPRLFLRDISRSYGDANQWYAIRNANLDVAPGEFLAVIGRSGSGKSTLLNVVALLDTTWRGNFEIGGVDVKTRTSSELDRLRARTFGFVFQSSNANPYESTARNAALGLAIQGVPLREQEHRVMRALELVGLNGKEGALARSLSGGERQRLAIARAIATNPSVIVADEPTGNLDSETSAQVMNVLSELNKSGTTVIVVSHDPSVAAYAHRVVRMSDGVLSQSDQPTIRSDVRPAQDTRPGPSSQSSTDYSRFASWRRAADRAYRAINNVTSRPLRSAALIGAFALAFAGLVGAAGIGTTASEQVADRLSAAARDEVRVNVPAGTSDAQRENWTAKVLNMSHVEAVGELASIDAATARTARFALLPDLDGAPFPGSTVAVNRSLLSTLQLRTTPASASRLFEGSSRVALVGKSVAQSLGLASNSVGAEIWVTGEPYTVVGTIVSSSREPGLLTSVVIPIGQLHTPASQLVARTSAGFSGPVAQAIPLALSPTAPGNISVDTASDLRNLRIGIQTDLNSLLGSLAVALLGVAVLSGASAMLISVQSRTQELALSRALGLSQPGVAAIFLWEGATIGLAGALAGISAGLAISVAVAAVRGWTAVMPWQTLGVAPVAGVIFGALAAILPAIRAARIDPAEAIR